MHILQRNIQKVLNTVLNISANSSIKYSDMITVVDTICCSLLSYFIII